MVEWVAQGVGNMTSGLLGGLPLTSVIVRSSANEAFSNRVIELDVRETMRDIVERSYAMRCLFDEGRVEVVGALYDVRTGQVRFQD